MPTNRDTINRINIHETGSTNPKSKIHCVNQSDNSSGKNNIHIAFSGKFSKNEKNTDSKKGAEKAHKNPASKPDQIYRLLKKPVNFLITPFNC